MASEVIDFGDVTVDLSRMTVVRSGARVPLEPKTFDVLRYLLQNRDRLVTKEELLDAVWKDTFVTPNVLTRAIAQLRKGLGDDAFEARYIETVSKRGYRFIAPVQVPPAPPEAAPARIVELPDVAPARSVPPAVLWLLGAIALVAVAAAAYSVRGRSDAASSQPASAQLSPRRFTTDSHSYAFPSISPDGRTVAYSSERGGSMEIYTAGVAPGSGEMALTSDGGQNMTAEWSPDGQWIAYHSRKKGGVWVVPSSGGAARQVVDFGSQPSWTPDGRRIVFTSDAGGMAAQSILWIVNSDGTDRRPLTKLGAPRGGHSKPDVSPTGRVVTFAVSHGFITTEIWTAPMDGGAGTKLGFGATPHFAGDGRSVFWVGRTSEGNDSLVRVRIDDAGAPLGEPEILQTFPGTFIGDFSIARDRTAVMWLYRALANLWFVDVPSQGYGRTGQLTSDDVRNTQPRHFDDGRIVFSQYAVGRPPTVWLTDEEGRTRESLTVGLSRAILSPQWAPDGKRVFVQARTLTGGHEFAWLDIATRHFAPIPASADGVLSPHLSPDGREMAFHVIDEGGVINVWKQPLDGGPRRQVTFDKEAMSYPTWSPDGQSIVVEIKRGDETHVGIVPKDGGEVELLVTDRGQSWPFSWSRDNDRIAFAGARDGVWNVYSVSRRRKDIRQLTNFTSVEGYVRYPSWSLTRDRIVFERADQRGSLWTAALPP